MSIIQISRIQHRTGNLSDLPQLSMGEFGWAVDEHRLFIGNDPNVIGPQPDNTEILTQYSTIVAGAGGNTTEVQFNLDGALAGNPSFTLDIDTQTLNMANLYTINLGSVANIHIGGGSNGQVLTTDGAGALRWSSVSGGSGTVTMVNTGGTGLGFDLTGGPITTTGTVFLNVPDAVTLRNNLNIGTVANINLNSNSAQVLSGAGTWVTISTGGTPGGNQWEVQFNNAGTFDATENFIYNKDDGTFLVNPSKAVEEPGNVVIRAASSLAVDEDFYAGDVSISAGDAIIPANVNISYTDSGTLNLYAGGIIGDGHQYSRSHIKLNLIRLTPSGLFGGGIELIAAKTSDAGISFTTGIPGTQAFRMEISSSGELLLDNDTGNGWVGGNPGAAGEVLQSQGPGQTPIWAGVSTPIVERVTSVNVSGGNTGLTTTGGPITTDGVITLGGTLAIAHGGTGQVTPNAAFNALAPSQATNSGKFLTTDGNNTSWSNVGSILNTVNIFTKNNSVTPVVLISGTTIPVDVSLSNNFKLVLGTNATLLNPTNATDGMMITIKIKQDSSGARTLAYGTNYKFPSGTVPSLTTDPGALDFLSMYYDADDGYWICVMQNGFA